VAEGVWEMKITTKRGRRGTTGLTIRLDWNDLEFIKANVPKRWYKLSPSHTLNTVMSAIWEHADLVAERGHGPR
jgi:hypothetical protein